MKIMFDNSLCLCRERERERERERGGLPTDPLFKNDWGEWRLNHSRGLYD